MKKLAGTLVLLFALTLSANAISTNDIMHSNNVKISLQEAMDLALQGNIELQKQRKDLGISKNSISSANALKNPQVQSNLLTGRIAKANSSQVGVMLPIEIAKRGARKQAAQANFEFTKNQIKDSEFKLKQKVRSAYFNLILAKSNLEIMKERKDLLEDLLEISKNRNKNSQNYEIELLYNPEIPLLVMYAKEMKLLS